MMLLIRLSFRLLQKTPGGEAYHQEYMKRVKSVPTAPMVLNIVPYLDKLTQTTMESDTVGNINMINFDKRRKIALALNELALYQRKNYELVRSRSFLEYGCANHRSLLSVFLQTENMPVEKFFMSLPAELDSDNQVASSAVAVSFFFPFSFD